jgi:iron(III) transport system ATP-binding protein
MISIRIAHLTKRFGTTTALADVSLTIEQGELFFLLGPSGCGKSTLLRALAGFATPDTGTIHFGDEEVTRLAPHLRQTGMMFQSYALWPHMTVAENVAFGLEERRVQRAERRARVAEALQAVRMEGYAERKPTQLSGGQQQRVALARALVVRPRCLLLDEPLSNLDARLRLELRSEIRRVCKEHQLTTVYVTHDQKEALSIADRVAVLEAGRLVQVAAPLELYRRPASRAVAAFVGEADFLPGRVTGMTSSGQPHVETAVGFFEGVLTDPAAPVLTRGAEVTVAIRPEAWTLREQPGAINSISGRVGQATFLGETAQYAFVPAVAPGMPLRVMELNPRAARLAAGAPLHATVAAEDVMVLTR